MKRDIPFFRHDLGEEELQAIREVIGGTILTTGEYVARFEEQFAKYLGRKYALGVTSCTAALHLSLRALEIGPGDEVITTPLTFIATSTAIIEAGATPVFVDVEEGSGNIDVSQIAKAITPRTKAIVPVHLYGVMADMAAMREIARHHRLAIVEDAAHCIEGIRDGLRPADAGTTACFSFFATKNLTCGEGGAIATDDENLYRKLKLLRLHGMNKTSSDRFREGYQHWDMPCYGWKCNMDNIQAAMLLPQMKRLDENLRRRQDLARHYDELFSSVPEVRRHRVSDKIRHANHLYTIRVAAGLRDGLIARLHESGIGAMVNYRPIHLLTYFRERFGHPRGSFPIAERIGDEILSLPFYPKMPFEHAEFVVAEVARALRGLSGGKIAA